MDIDQARTLAQPNPTAPGTAKIFTRSEAAEMSRARDALRQSSDPADEALADAADRAVCAFVESVTDAHNAVTEQGAKRPRLHRPSTLLRMTLEVCRWAQEAAAAPENAAQTITMSYSIATVREAARAALDLLETEAPGDIEAVDVVYAAVERFLDAD